MVEVLLLGPSVKTFSVWIVDVPMETLPLAPIMNCVAPLEDATRNDASVEEATPCTMSVAEFADTEVLVPSP